MTRPSTDHVTVSFDSGEIRCGHCSDFHAPNCEIPAAVLVEQLRGFLLMHRLCPKPEAPSRQMSLSEARCHICEGPGPLTPDGWDNVCAECLRKRQAPDIGAPPIDASTDEPAPEIDPPGQYARFEEMYPIAKNAGTLYSQLHSALTPEQWNKLPNNCPWHKDSGIFNAVANWARIEKAHAEAGKRAPIAGLTLPRREPMPEKLAELLGVKPKQKKGARPLVNPKRKRKTATP